MALSYKDFKEMNLSPNKKMRMLDKSNEENGGFFFQSCNEIMSETMKLSFEDNKISTAVLNFAQQFSLIFDPSKKINLKKIYYDRSIIGLFLQIIVEDLNSRNAAASAKILNNLLNIDYSIYSEQILAAITFCQNKVTNPEIFEAFLGIITLFVNFKNTAMPTSKMFPISIVSQYFSPFVFSDVVNNSINYLKYLYSIVFAPHSKEDARIVFEEVHKILKFSEEDPKKVKYICWILIKMIEQETIPRDLFSEYKFVQLIDILMKSKNSKIIANSTYLAGYVIEKLLDEGYFSIKTIIDLIFDNQECENIIIPSVWILSLTCTKHDVYALYNSKIILDLCILYFNSSFNTKTEIALLLADVIYISDELPDFLLSDGVIDVFLDFMNIGDDQNTAKVANVLFCTIAECDEFCGKEKARFFIQFLLENNFSEIVDHFLSSEDEDMVMLGQLYQKMFVLHMNSFNEQ